MNRRISVRARFERFPATVKGAFILRGDDADPHQVVFHEVRAVAVAGSERRPIQVAATTLDVVPHRDVFVPFELLVADLEPGWYGFECELEVDGDVEIHPGGRRFAVPWPRGTVRRGPIRVGKTIDLGGRTSVRVEQLDCGGDSMKVALGIEPPGPVTVRLFADDTRLEVLETESDGSGAHLKVTAFPLMRSHRVLRLELKGRGKGAEGSLDVRLP